MHKQYKGIKGIIFLLLCFFMFFTMTHLVNAAQVSDKASIIRLEKKEGDVTVENASGEEVALKNKLRLYSGYGVETESASYAWISLDDTKALELDASSAGQVLKSGKNLEVKLVSGQMFFNVTKPLEEDETLIIRTSNMVTGIRGTAGYTEKIDAFTSRITLLEGTADVFSIDQDTGDVRITQISGGQTLTLVDDGDDNFSEDEQSNAEQQIQEHINNKTIREEFIISSANGLRLEMLQEEDIPGIIALAVAEDMDLQERISSSTDLSVDRIISDAQQRLNNEQEEASAREAEISNQLAALQADNVTPLFELPITPPVPSSVQTPPSAPPTPAPTSDLTVQTETETEEETEEKTEGGGSASDNSGSSNDTTPPTSDEITLDNPTTLAVSDALANYKTINVTNADPVNWSIVESGVPTGKTIIVKSGTVLVNNPTSTSTSTPTPTPTSTSTPSQGDSSKAFTIYGTLTIESEASMTVDNVSAVHINSSNSLHIEGKLLNDGEIYVGYSSAGKLVISGTVNGTGAINVQNNSTFETSGVITNQMITNSGTMTVTGGNITTTRIDAPCISNGGTLNVSDFANICHSGISEQSIGILNNGDLIITSGSISGVEYGVYSQIGADSLTISGDNTVIGKASGTNSDGTETDIDAYYGLYILAGTTQISDATIGSENTSLACSFNTSSDCSVSLNNCTINGATGCSVGETANVDFIGCNITSYSSHGIASSGTLTLDSTNVTCNSETDSGIAIEMGTANITGGTIYGNSFGIEAESGATNIAISNTTIGSENTSLACSFKTSSDCSVSLNNCTINGATGCSVGATANVGFIGCNITSYSSHGIENYGILTLDSTNVKCNSETGYALSHSSSTQVTFINDSALTSTYSGNSVISPGTGKELVDADGKMLTYRTGMIGDNVFGLITEDNTSPTD